MLFLSNLFLLVASHPRMVRQFAQSVNHTILFSALKQKSTLVTTDAVFFVFHPVNGSGPLFLVVRGQIRCSDSHKISGDASLRISGSWCSNVANMGLEVRVANMYVKRFVYVSLIWVWVHLIIGSSRWLTETSSCVISIPIAKAVSNICRRSFHFHILLDRRTTSNTVC